MRSMAREVTHGDPFRSLLFNIAMNPLLKAISAKMNSFTWDDSGLQLEALCYADDNGLLELTEDPKEMQLDIDVFHDWRSSRYEIKKSRQAMILSLAQ